MHGVFALERQDLSCTYLAHHERKNDNITIILHVGVDASTPI